MLVFGGAFFHILFVGKLGSMNFFCFETGCIVPFQRKKNPNIPTRCFDQHITSKLVTSEPRTSVTSNLDAGVRKLSWIFLKSPGTFLGGGNSKIFGLFTPYPWGFMIQFDDIIFFKWVGKNHQLDFVSFLWLFCSSFCFSDYIFCFQLCQFWVMILVKRSKHKNFVSPKTIKTQRSWCSGCEREENKKRVLKHLEKWPAVDQNGEWRKGQFFKLLHELEGGGDRVYKQNSSGRLVPFWASYGAMDVLSFFFLIANSLLLGKSTLKSKRADFFSFLYGQLGLRRSNQVLRWDSFYTTNVRWSAEAAKKPSWRSADLGSPSGCRIWRFQNFHPRNPATFRETFSI